MACSQRPGSQSTTDMDNNDSYAVNNSGIFSGAERIGLYLELLKKSGNVGIFSNHTSVVGNGHLVDTLRKLGVNIKVIFGPEHGFRGTASAGEKIGNYVDEKTGIPVISLYGSKRKPTAEDIKDIDILIFDIQDVGTRFYTYISSMQEFMEAAIENEKPLIILDRPNPNGHYVDGPVLDLKFRSFVGMQPVPIVYGMTMAEYGQMLLRESMLAKNDPHKVVQVFGVQSTKEILAPSLKAFRLLIVPCSNYTHKSKYHLPVKPSPNLPEMQAIYLYPTTCLFEGTALSEGRGTAKPFEYIGHPDLPKNMFSFTPNPNEGAKSSKHYGKVCYGWNFGGTVDEVLKKVNNKIQLQWLFDAYKIFPNKDSFFLRTNSFNRLSGTDQLMQQIKEGKSEEEIRKSWEPKLSEFKAVRKKYLLYEDFE